VYQGIVSEFPPSESTVIRKIAFDAIYLRHLRDSCNIPSVTKVATHEMASCNMLFVIQLDRRRSVSPGKPCARPPRSMHRSARSSSRSMLTSIPIRWTRCCGRFRIACSRTAMPRSFAAKFRGSIRPSRRRATYAS